jgi:cytochrome c oxidase subunit 2
MNTLNELLRRALFLPPQASTMARDVDTLHYFIIITTMAGATAITLAGLILVVRYRARARADETREDPTARPPLWAEAGVVAGLLGLFCLWWVIGFGQYVRLEVAPENALTIYVTAKQWMWKFAYPSGDSSISTLYVPAGRPVRLVMTSRDVIHSFYVPDFRVKQDVLPGRYTTTWFATRAPGTHPVFCAEYCGLDHSLMRAEVVALSASDYARWLASGGRGGGIAGPRDGDALSVDSFVPPEPLDLARTGTRVAAELGCLRCHTLDGSPHIGPTWAGLYRTTVPLADGKTVVADEAYLTESMMDPQARLHAGYQAVMPSYLGLMSPAQTAAIVELMKTLRDLPRAPGPGSSPPPALPIEVDGKALPPEGPPGALPEPLQ